MRHVAVEAGVVAMLIAAGVWYGVFAFTHAVSRPDYNYLSPAVMLAVGQGFRQPVAAPGSRLEAFLAGRIAAIALEDVTPARIDPPDGFHQSVRYLAVVVGAWWKIRGISWDEVAGVAAGLHALAVVGTYALLRLFVGWPLAAAGALWICVSTLQLGLVPHVRDYSKGAFILASLPFVVALAVACRSPRSLYLTAGGLGLVIGLGLGFKMDVAIMAPLAAGAVVLFRGERPWRDLGEKSRALACMAAALLIAAGPVLAGMRSGGSNAAHVVILGQAEQFNRGLGLDQPPYSLVPLYSDAYVAQVVHAHHGQPDSPLASPSAEYDEASVALWFGVLRHFPADFAVRALAACVAVLNLIFENPDPGFLTARLPAQDAQMAIYAFLQRAAGQGIALGLALVAVAALESRRRGMLAALLVLYLGGYTSLQFDTRHIFHTQVIPVAALVLVAAAAVAGLRRIVSRVRRQSTDADIFATGAAWPLLRRVGGAVAAMALVVAVPTAILRAYQSEHLEALLVDHLRASRSPVPVSWTESPSGTWRGELPVDPRPVPASGLRVETYLLAFEEEATRPLHVGLQYDAAAADLDFSRMLSLEATPGLNHLGFSAFTVGARTRLAAIDLGPDARRRLAGVYRVESDAPAGLPLDLRLPAAWRDGPLYQRHALETDAGSSGEVPHVTCALRPACRGVLAYAERIDRAPLDVEAARVRAVHASIVTVQPERIVVDGPVDSESSYLMEWHEQAWRGAGAFVVRGHLYQGGVAAGLLRQGRWHAYAEVRRPGPFTIVIPVDESGSFVPVLTNSMPAGLRQSRVEIDRVLFVDDDPHRPEAP